jgi:hypothetical protein
LQKSAKTTYSTIAIRLPISCLAKLEWGKTIILPFVCYFGCTCDETFQRIYLKIISFFSQTIRSVAQRMCTYGLTNIHAIISSHAKHSTEKNMKNQMTVFISSILYYFIFFYVGGEETYKFSWYYRNEIYWNQFFIFCIYFVNRMFIIFSVAFYKFVVKWNLIHFKTLSLE